MAKSSIHLGTSGWTYGDWKGRFYPQHLAQSKWLEYYSERFSTVELNASFYRIPSVAAVEGWAKHSPSYFRFAVKVSRLISHIKKLKDCEREIDWFFTTFAPLEAKIGVYLLQLPPTLKGDPELLRNFARLLPAGIRLVIEFRSRDWYHEEIYAALKELGFAFCIHDIKGSSTERIVLSDIAYLRFHGFQARYGGDYPDESLADWARWIKDQNKAGTRIYGYFNNDSNGFAVKNCMTLRTLLDELQHPE